MFSLIQWKWMLDYECMLLAESIGMLIVHFWAKICFTIFWWRWWCPVARNPNPAWTQKTRLVIWLLFAWMHYSIAMHQYQSDTPLYAAQRFIKSSTYLPKCHAVLLIPLNHLFSSIIISFWSKSLKNHITFIFDPKFMRLFA